MFLDLKALATQGAGVSQVHFVKLGELTINITDIHILSLNDF